jgi:hypothetical protein
MNDPKEPTPPEEEFVKEILLRKGLPLDAKISINIHTKRVRVNPDGTRTTISESDSSEPAAVITAPRKGRSRRLKQIGAIVALAGLAQTCYAVWTDRSDEAAAIAFRGSPSCAIGRVSGGDTTAPSTVGACRVEAAVVMSRRSYSSRGSTSYYVTTVTPSGQRDDTPLARPEGRAFWSRVQPTQRVVVQRFVANGYHLTGSVTAMSDGRGVAMTRSHPDSGTHYVAMSGVLGLSLFLIGGLILYRNRNE